MIIKGNKENPLLMLIDNVFISNEELDNLKCKRCKSLAKNTFFKNQPYIKVKGLINFEDDSFTVHIDLAHYKLLNPEHIH